MEKNKDIKERNKLQIEHRGQFFPNNLKHVPRLVRGCVIRGGRRRNCFMK